MVGDLGAPGPEPSRSAPAEPNALNERKMRKPYVLLRAREFLWVLKIAWFVVYLFVFFFKKNLTERKHAGRLDKKNKIDKAVKNKTV